MEHIAGQGVAQCEGDIGKHAARVVEGFVQDAAGEICGLEIDVEILRRGDAGFFANVVVIVDGFLDKRQDLAAKRGEIHAAPGAAKERSPDFLFKAGDGCGERRLADVDLFCSQRERAIIGDLQKIFQLFDSHENPPFFGRARMLGSTVTPIIARSNPLSIAAFSGWIFNGKIAFFLRTFYNLKEEKRKKGG